MAQSARIVGEVSFRTGDGPKLPIPKGAVQIESNETEATLSWEDGEAKGVATIPIEEFRTYVAEGAIKLPS